MSQQAPSPASELLPLIHQLWALRKMDPQAHGKVCRLLIDRTDHQSPGPRCSAASLVSWESEMKHCSSGEGTQRPHSPARPERPGDIGHLRNVISFFNHTTREGLLPLCLFESP